MLAARMQNHHVAADWDLPHLLTSGRHHVVSAKPRENTASRHEYAAKRAEFTESAAAGSLSRSLSRVLSYRMAEGAGTNTVK